MIVVCGEALIDLIPTHCHGETAYVARVGGSPFNVAVTIGRLEGSVALLSQISEDRFGRRLREHLRQSGVDTQLLLTSPQATPLALVQTSNAEPDYTFYLDGTTVQLTSEQLPDTLPDAVSALHFGSLSIVLEPAASALESLLLRESTRRVITLDPNVRANLVPDMASYRRRLDGWLGQADIVKASRDDLAVLEPDRDVRRVARDWHARGAAIVVITDGGAGALGICATGEVEVPAIQVRVADTVGAGDAFMGGLLTWLDAQGRLTEAALATLAVDDVRQAVSFAARVAALTCAQVGADPPRRAEVRPGL